MKGRHVVHISVMSLLLVAFGCGDSKDTSPNAAIDPPKGDDAIECRLNSDCAIGLVCFDGMCLVECREDRDCAVSEVCAQGMCTAIMSPNHDNQKDEPANSNPSPPDKHPLDGYEPATGSDRWSPEAICGPSTDFIHIEEQASVDAGVYQYAGPVGNLRKRDPDKRLCSGTLISEDLYLTAGHCLADDTQETCDNFQVDFDYQREGGRNGAVKSYNMDDGEAFRCEEIIARVYEGDDDGELDYAVMRLEGDPGEKYGFASITQALGEGDSITIIQHPQGSVKVYDQGTIESIGSTRSFYNVDTLGGSSGSGVLNGNGVLHTVHNARHSDEQCVGDDGNNGTMIAAIVDHDPDLLRDILDRQSNPSVSAISPTRANLGERVIFDIVGEDLPHSLAAYLPGCSDQTWLQRGRSLARFTCTIRWGAGNESLVVKDRKGGTTLGTFSVSIVDSTQGNAFVSAVTPERAVVDDPMTFVLSGVNFDEAPSLAAYIENCVDLTWTKRTESEAHFTCIPRGSLGEKYGVIKDEPGGTILLEFEVDFVEGPEPPDDCSHLGDGEALDQGMWSECVYDSVCATVGERSLDVTRCRGGEPTSETITSSESCTRETEGNSCGDEQVCIAGSCEVPMICSPGTLSCDSLGDIRMCDADGAGRSVHATCHQNMLCDDSQASVSCSQAMSNPLVDCPVGEQHSHQLVAVDTVAREVKIIGVRDRDVCLRGSVTVPHPISQVDFDPHGDGMIAVMGETAGARELRLSTYTFKDLLPIDVDSRPFSIPSACVRPSSIALTQQSAYQLVVACTDDHASSRDHVVWKLREDSQSKLALYGEVDETDEKQMLLLVQGVIGRGDGVLSVDRNGKGFYLRDSSVTYQMNLAQAGTIKSLQMYKEHIVAEMSDNSVRLYDHNLVFTRELLSANPNHEFQGIASPDDAFGNPMFAVRFIDRVEIRKFSDGSLISGRSMSLTPTDVTFSKGDAFVTFVDHIERFYPQRLNPVSIYGNDSLISVTGAPKSMSINER